MPSLIMDSPVRPFRQPRFSVGSESPNENVPVNDNLGDQSQTSSTFPRQIQSSPTKYQERSVLLLLGNKVPSSVPGRRSSIGCTKERKELAPIIVFEDDAIEENQRDACMKTSTSIHRSRSLRPLSASNRAAQWRSLKRL